MKILSDRGLAVVTGAAGGLGSSFANKLAEQGYRLLLVDRRQTELEQVCESITTRYGVGVEPCAVDFCKRDEIERLSARLAQTAAIEFLVNNAGFGTPEYFADTDARYLIGMIDVHVVAPTMLTRAVLPAMIERGSGTIINVSSLAAFFQTAGNTQYGSTKNYLAVFSATLQQELRGTNVRVQALCPGFVRTDFHGSESMKQFDMRWAPSEDLWLTPDEVVEFSLRKLSCKQVLAIPGLRYSLLGRLARMPLLQPLIQWLGRRPRLTPALSATTHVCSKHAFEIAKSA